MTAAMAIFGVPPVITYITVTAILMIVVLSGRYWTFEKITLLFCGFNFVYIPAAFWAMETGTAPAWGEVFKGFYHPDLPQGLTADLLFIIMANIGTTITPWQIFFQQSAVVDKGLDIKDIRFGKIDTFAGSFFTCVVAAFIVITTGAAFYYHNPPITVEDARQTAEAIVPLLPHREGVWARALFGIGLFDAGFLGALCISLATSWAVGEVFGWAHSLNKGVKDAPWFYVIYFFCLASSGAVVLIPKAPLIMITMFVQVIAVTLLPAALLFLILLLNDKPLMGEHVNTRWENIANWSITGFVIIMSTLFGISVLFPGLSWAGVGGSHVSEQGCELCGCHKQQGVSVLLVLRAPEPTGCNGQRRPAWEALGPCVPASRSLSGRGRDLYGARVGKADRVHTVGESR